MVGSARHVPAAVSHRRRLSVACLPCYKADRPFNLPLQTFSALSVSFILSTSLSLSLLSTILILYQAFWWWTGFLEGKTCCLGRHRHDRHTRAGIWPHFGVTACAFTAAMR